VSVSGPSLWIYRAGYGQVSDPASERRVVDLPITRFFNPEQ
jgi:hypothetical protein